MMHARTLLILAVVVCFGGALSVYALITTQPASTVTPAPPAQFPILSQFELSRDYGYFIGDEIPLTLVIETAADVVLDLVNLPQKGDTHGLFEIRDLHITSSPGENTTQIYRAAYILQYFGPTPYSAPFGPLEILYALPRAPGASQATYTYKRLLTQPAVIHIARLAPLRVTQAVQLKGPVDDQRAGIIWASFFFGTMLVLTAVGGWGWEGYRAWQRRRALAARTPTPAERALQTLQHDATTLFCPPQEPPPPIGVTLDHIIRTYLHAAHQVPAFTLTPAELALHLEGVPHAQNLLRLIERCAALKYQPPAASLTAEQTLWRDTIALFEHLQEESAP
jgi:hypothetical protein